MHDVHDKPDVLLIYAVNRGRHEVVVSSLCIEIPELCRITPLFVDKMTESEHTNNKYPLEENDRLKSGQRLEISFDNHTLIEEWRRRGLEMPLRVRAVFEDTLENVFYSSWFEIGGD